MSLDFQAYRRWHDKKTCPKKFIPVDKEGIGRALTVLDCDGRCNPEQKGNIFSWRYFEFISVVTWDVEEAKVVEKFRLGGLYWYAKDMEYVECTRKVDDIAELTYLFDDKKVLAYDGEESYEDAKTGPLNRHIAYVRGEAATLRQKLQAKNAYLAKLENVWPNVTGG